jgi:hypothetical protein
MFSTMGDDGGNQRGVCEAQFAWRGQSRPRLSEAAGNGRWVLAVCACGEAAAIDVADWIDEGLGTLRLSAFEGRLRCACGARQVRLAAGGGATPGPGAANQVIR